MKDIHNIDLINNLQKRNPLKMKASLRESMISYINEDKLFGDKEIVLEFKKYLDAYCAELKHTENDVLMNDEHYDLVYHLFDNIILKNKPELVL